MMEATTKIIQLLALRMIIHDDQIILYNNATARARDSVNRNLLFDTTSIGDLS